MFLAQSQPLEPTEVHGPQPASREVAPQAAVGPDLRVVEHIADEQCIGGESERPHSRKLGHLLGVVAGNAEIVDLELVGPASLLIEQALEYLGVRVVRIHFPAEGHRVAERNDSEYVARLCLVELNIPESMGIRPEHPPEPLHVHLRVGPQFIDQ